MMSSKLGHFVLHEEIAQGGMGTVFRASDPTLGRDVAIKVLRKELSQDPKILSLFLGEARGTAIINHPHVVQVHFLGEEKGQPYIVMELLKGSTMLKVIEKDGALDEERALVVGTEVADALRSAYRGKILHGDIKPSNIFLTVDAGAKLLDFGLSKLVDAKKGDIEQVWGTPHYVSPERLGLSAEDFHTDIYSLGVTLFHALTGQLPFDAPKADETAMKRLIEKPPKSRVVNPNLTPQTAQVVDKMLNKSTLIRFRDYDHLLEDLNTAKSAAMGKRLGIIVRERGLIGMFRRIARKSRG